MTTPKEIVKHELIGLGVEVSYSKDPSYSGMKGKVVDESRNTLSIDTASGVMKTAVKDRCEFVFTLPSGKRVKVDGRLLLARPEDRIKKRQKKW